MTCRNCKYLMVHPDAAGRVIARKDKTYTCTVDVPMPPLPVSVTISHSWRWPPPRSRVAPDDGDGCPFHETRVTGTRAA